ncbi:hypothetical protein [Paenibacillus sp. J22TS3]|uniref:hypothetical protein n=1 Tax=Paenibacillus sp. J22TS3 TaxID=2807192 RepID=UPI001B266291|nr:hypothetical protein [Paenibacillus sp. J22TS3]GIP20164.1 hypothetical protein J22TS3_04390 [Paenibacillus sp. J22TS3]
MDTLSHTYVLKELGLNPKAQELINLIKYFLISDQQKLDFIKEARHKQMLFNYPVTMMGRLVRDLLWEIRLRRLKSTTLSLEQFLADYGSDPILALENMLQEHIQPGKMHRFASSGMTAEQMYWLHMRNPEDQMMELILKYEMSPSKKSTLI